MLPLLWIGSATVEAKMYRRICMNQSLTLTRALNHILFLNTYKQVSHSQLFYEKVRLQQDQQVESNLCSWLQVAFFLRLPHFSHWDFWWIIKTNENSQILCLRFHELFFTITYIFHQNGFNMFWCGNFKLHWLFKDMIKDMVKAVYCKDSKIVKKVLIFIVVTNIDNIDILITRSGWNSLKEIIIIFIGVLSSRC